MDYRSAQQQSKAIRDQISVLRTELASVQAAIVGPVPGMTAAVGLSRREVTLTTETDELSLVDFSRLNCPYPYVCVMQQSLFLDCLIEEAKQLR